MSLSSIWHSRPASWWPRKDRKAAWCTGTVTAVDSVRRLVQEVDATGAGDVFATCFFVRLFQTRDPWEAGRFATILAAHTVTRVGLDGIPTAREIEECLMEVLQ